MQITTTTTTTTTMQQHPQQENIIQKRGRPKLEEISSLIKEGVQSKSPIRCRFCKRAFPREKSLQAHQRIHTGERPYRCTHPGCHKSFVQSGQLRTHQRLHTGEKPFRCNECKNRFTHANRRCPDHPNAGVRRNFESNNTLGYALNSWQRGDEIIGALALIELSLSKFTNTPACHRQPVQLAQ